MNKVTVDQRNYRTFIEMNLQNRAPKIVHNMNIVARVYKDGQSEPAYSFQTDNFRMAPNSNFNVGVPTGDIPILPGEYQAILEVTTDEKTYEFNKKFVINRKIANELNYSAVNINTQGYTWVYIAGCFLILIIFLIIVKQLQIKRRCSN
ncbi:TPA: DUF3324 domain-containing protein [Enterococcus faecium]|uniref:DUF3324 domain-containing protein n=1 Tax=Enterococcus faecium TaxID=1352 RepID=UPI000A331DA7|nr:DUF3324 domain-containing protein [Enterococcus faecium]